MVRGYSATVVDIARTYTGRRHLPSPSHLGDAAGALETFWGVLVDFKFVAIGILQPGLPGFVAANFLFGAVDALGFHAGDKLVDVVGLEAEMDKRGVGDLGERDFEDLDVGGIAAVEVGAVELTVFFKGKTNGQCEFLAVEFDRAMHVGYLQTDMG